MTNKTEMVSEYSALTYKDLAERLAHYLSSALVSAQYSMNDETMHDALGLCDQVTRRKSAPPEDVAGKMLSKFCAECGADGLHFPDTSPCAHCLYDRKYNTTPAEDVRAVVEESVAWRGCNSNGEVVTEWIDGAPPENMFDLCGNAASFDKIERAYRHPQRPAVMPDRLREVWLFLDGQAELEGCVFGEKPEGRHNVWWRKELRAVLEELYPAQ